MYATTATEGGCEAGDRRIMQDYFAPNTTNSSELFCSSFRMQKRPFLRIASALEELDSYLRQRRDAAVNLGLSTIRKMTAAIWQLAYGSPADAVDEYLQIGESTLIEGQL